MHLTNVLRINGRVVLLLLLLPMLLGGCVSLATDSRKVGLQEMQKGGHRPGQGPRPARGHPPEERDRAHRRRPPALQAGAGRRLRLARARQRHARQRNLHPRRQGGGKIVVIQAILDHELNHLLQFANPCVQDPDRLDGIGA